MSMMLLGKCPWCEGEDTICQFSQETGNPDDCCKVECSACSTSWENWLVLVKMEDGKGNKLIPIEIERLRSCNGQERGVQLAWLTIDEIPFYNLIVSVLNTALMARYGLRPSLHPRGGIEGYYKGSYIELLNDNYHPGLYVAKNKPRGKEVRKILDFYHLMFHHLFESGSLGNGQFHRGEILRLSESQRDKKRAWEILITVLSTAGSNGFARKVEKMTMEVWSKPWSVPA